jgi:pyrimidine deaminase RibD-like protein
MLLTHFRLHNSPHYHIACANFTIRAMLSRLFDDHSEIKDSTFKNRVQDRPDPAAFSAAQNHPTNPHARMMALALEQAEKCEPTPTAFCVGAVLTSSAGEILSTGYSRELPGNTHAEQVCLSKVNNVVPEGALLYTTMEPCSKRLSGNKSCVDRILECDGKIKTVYVGTLEPETFVNNTGEGVLKKHGVNYMLVPGLASDCLKVARKGHSSPEPQLGEGGQILSSKTAAQ